MRATARQTVNEYRGQGATASALLGTPTRPDAHQRVLDMIFGRWRSQILYAGVRLGIFDALADGGKNAALTAAELGLDASLCYRLLRALGSLELLHEDRERTFSLNEAGRLLLADSGETLRGVALLEEGPEHYALWKHLPEMVRDGRQNAFVREVGRMAFEHADRDPEYARAFNEAMSSYSSAQTALVLEALDAYDFSSIGHICDIGGGHGHMLCHLLAKHRHLRGTVVDLPSVVENRVLLWADRLGVGDRCTYAAGDMFVSVPRADAYTMKMILHDWNDEECVRILRNIFDAATPGSRVFVIEHVIPDPHTPHFSKLFDIHMMCWGTGRERTVDEYATLMEKAGWRYAKTWFPGSRAIGVVEGMKPERF